MPQFIPYAPRAIRWLGLAERHGHRLKRYAITRGDEPLRERDFAEGFELACQALPLPAVTSARPGVGFAISHQGNGADYSVLAWWDNENELPLRVFVRPQEPGGAWRSARESESVCVWDLEIVSFERDAYVATLLAGGTADDYLARRLA